MSAATTLEASLNRALAGLPVASLSTAADRLREAYRSGRLPDHVLLSGQRASAAYAAYRMPATFAATRAAVAQLSTALPGFIPTRLLDLGAGTGAATWAVLDRWDVEQADLLEQSASAIELGKRKRIAEGTPVSIANWRLWHVRATDVALPAADLAVAAYLLAELDPATCVALVAAMAVSATTVLIIEPGTPRGYEHIVKARQQLKDAGLRIIAPCPHEHECPLASTRAQKLLRQRSHEDEKFSFVAAVRDQLPQRPRSRVLRHPRTRKGLVLLDLCQEDGQADQHVVSKRQGDLYRAARNTAWETHGLPTSPI